MIITRWSEVFFYVVITLGLWISFHLGYAKGEHIQMLADRRILDNCNAVIMRNYK